MEKNVFEKNPFFAFGKTLKTTKVIFAQTVDE